MTSTTSTALSACGASHDEQVIDALGYLRMAHYDVYAELIGRFPQAKRPIWDGAWFDTEAMGVDDEWSPWLTHTIEDTGLVRWLDGEPFAGPFDDEEES